MLVISNDLYEKPKDINLVKEYLRNKVKKSIEK